MIRSIILFVCLLFANITNAQEILPFTIGPMVSMTSTSLSADPSFQNQVAGSGYNIGGFARIKILLLYAQLEGSFGSKSASVTTMLNSTGSDVTFKLSGLDLGLLG